MKHFLIPAEFRFLLLSAAFALGEYLAFTAPGLAEAYPFFLFAALLAALLGYGLKIPLWREVTAFFIGSSLAFIACGEYREDLNDFEGKIRGKPHCPVPGRAAVELTVEDPIRIGKENDDVRWVSFNASSGRLKLRVICPLPSAADAPRTGETWSCRGHLAKKDVEDPSRRHEFWINGRGTFARKLSDAPPRGTFAAAKKELSERMGIGLDHAPETAALNRAILLGERAALPKSVRNTFVRAGTMHVFAISGLHVMIIAQLLAVIAALLMVPYRFTAFAVIPALWAYVAITGSAPSAVRAALMASFYFLAPLAYRRPNGVIAWSAAFITLHAIDPAMILDVGAALSFTVMLGIILWGRVISLVADGRIRLLSITAAAWLSGLPIAAHVFGHITPGGLIANLPLVPAAGAGVIASFLGVAASFVSVTLAAHINNFAALFTEAMLRISEVAAALPFADFEMPGWTNGICLEFYAAMILAVFLCHSVLVRKRNGL